MKIEEFKKMVEVYLVNEPSNKAAGAESVELETNLWDSGLIDSFRTMELILFLEDQLGKEISVESNYLSNFYTIQAMYDSLVKSESNSDN